MDIVKGLEKRNIKSIIKNSIIQKTFVTLYQKNKKPIIIYLNLSDKVQELNRFTSVMFIIFILFNLNWKSTQLIFKLGGFSGLFIIWLCVLGNDAVFNYIISINKVMNSFLINVILLKFFLIYTLKNILLNNNKLFKLLIKEDIFISIYFSI